MTLQVRSLDHTAIAVRRIEDALPLYRDVLGGEPVEFTLRPEKGFQALLLRFPGQAGIELLAPLGETSFLHAFLAQRGEGVHHLTFMVDDLPAAVAEARAAGLRVVGEDYADPTWQEAFISPRSAHGTIVQLAQSSLDPAGRTALWPADAHRIDRRARGESAAGRLEQLEVHQAQLGHEEQAKHDDDQNAERGE